MTLSKISVLLIFILLSITFFVLPMQIRLNLAHMLFSSFMLVILYVILWKTLTIPEPMEAMVEIRGRRYYFPNLPDNFSLILNYDAPELLVGNCEVSIPVLHFTLKTKEGFLCEVVFRSPIGTVLFKESKSRIGETISIPPESLATAGINTKDLPVNIQIRGGLR